MIPIEALKEVKVGMRIIILNKNKKEKFRGKIVHVDKIMHDVSVLRDDREQGGGIRIKNSRTWLLRKHDRLGHIYDCYETDYIIEEPSSKIKFFEALK